MLMHVLSQYISSLTRLKTDDIYGRQLISRIRRQLETLGFLGTLHPAMNFFDGNRKELLAFFCILKDINLIKFLKIFPPLFLFFFPKIMF